MAAYFNREHHPQQALLPRAGFVALDANAVAGYIAGHLTRRFGYNGEVQYLYVAPEYRRQGIATALLRLMGGWFHDQNASRVCVNVNVDSPAAAPFYLSQGASVLNEYWYVWEDITRAD
jgi:GNAT superfamily N-acetyltransferase